MFCCFSHPSWKNHWFYLIYLIFNFLFFGIEQYIDTSFGYCCIFFYLLCFIYLSTVVFGIIDCKHHFLCWWIFRGTQYTNWRQFFFLWYFEVPFENKDLKNDLNWTETTGVFRHETLERLLSKAVLHLYWRIFLMYKRKKSDKPGPFAASTKTVYAYPFCCFYPLWNEVNHVSSTVCLRSTDVKNHSSELSSHCWSHEWNLIQTHQMP